MSTGTAPSPYTPNFGQMSGAYSGLNSAANSLGSLAGSAQNNLLGGFESIYQNLLNNPYYGAYQAGMGATGQKGVNFGQSELDQASGLQALGNQYASYIPGVMQTAYDPQNALYNRTQNAVMNQANAGIAQAGLGGSPYGAALAGQQASNFALDWQNNQQQRELAGLGGATQLGQADSAMQAMAGDLGKAGLDTMYQGYAAPYQAYTGNQNVLAEALRALAGGYGTVGSLYEGQGGLYNDYLSQGQNAEQLNLSAWEAQQKANSSLWGGIGGLLGMGLDAFGGGGLFSPGGIFGGGGGGLDGMPAWG